MKFALSLQKPMAGIGIAAVTLLAASPASSAVPDGLILPPLSAPSAQYFREHPLAWERFVSNLPGHPRDAQAAASPRALPPSGGHWQAVNAAPASGLFNPLLLTDGTVIVAASGSPDWYRLTPDLTGSYVNGTWSQLASLPVIGGTQYAPQYFASAVLPDGRVIVMGGEYNNNSLADSTLGAIYDPQADIWTPVAAPSGWSSIGDSQGIVLADGTFMLGACCANPDVDALLDAATLSWTNTGAPSAGGAYQDEQGYEALPDGNVLTIDIWTNSPHGNATNAEQYVPSSGTWISAGNTLVSLVDPWQCGNWEIGPAVLRPDGTVVAFGGNSGCSTLVKALGTSAAADPTAIYDSSNGTWSAGPNVPEVCKSASSAGYPTNYCTLADAPAALMPNGNILIAASAGYGQNVTHFFEFTSATSTSPNTIDQVADTLYYASVSSSYNYNFLVLPNGQILSTDFSDIPEIYVPTGSASAAWAPTISSAPSVLTVGGTYSISGLQFNGLSQGAYYGDDVQAATNYPIVRVTNTGTGHVFYARTFDHGTMSVEPGASGSTRFTLPENLEKGASTLVVIANGIPSSPVSVSVVAGLMVLPTTLAFGSEAIDVASGALTVTVTNNDSVAVPITGITFSGQNPYAFSQTNNCGATLAAAAQCTISVVFDPGLTGSKHATLSVHPGNGIATQTVALTGTGVVAPYTVSPTSVAFGAEAIKVASASSPVTVTNPGSSALPITSITLSGHSPTMFSQTNTCQNAIAAAGNCTISVVFTPTATGPQSATLLVNAGNGAGTQTVALTGTGVVVSYTALPASLAFGSEALGVASTAKTITVVNDGATTLPLTSITLSGPDPHMFAQTNTCGAFLAAGGSCTISVVFDPASAGPKTATLTISARDGTESQAIALSGAGA